MTKFRNSHADHSISHVLLRTHHMHTGCTSSACAQVASCLWAFQYKPSSPLSTPWLHFPLSCPLVRRENKRQTCNNLRLVAHTSSLHATTYVPIFQSSSSKRTRESFKSCENNPESSFPTAQLLLPCIIASSTRISRSELLLSGSAICNAAILNWVWH